MREDGFDNFVHLMHLLRENSEPNFDELKPLTVLG